MTTFILGLFVGIVLGIVIAALMGANQKPRPSLSPANAP